MFSKLLLQYSKNGMFEIKTDSTITKDKSLIRNSLLKLWVDYHQPLWPWSSPCE